MHHGLNIGLGAWIAQQAKLTTLPILPNTAIPFRLQHLSTIKTQEDRLIAEELSRLANRVVGAGCEYDSGELPQYLWTVHKDLWSKLDIAISTLSIGEREELKKADEILFNQDGLPSIYYLTYLEYRRIHEDLLLQADSPESTQAVNFAFTEWVAVGHKQLVETALAVKVRLSRNSSLITSQQDVSMIMVALEAGGADVPFVPTYFAPLSATSTENWLEAEVDFQVLEDALPPEAPHNIWLQFRANKTGSVRFKYIAIDLLRPWLSTELYSARDWRLPVGEVELVADGNGRVGQLPAYLSKVYLAQVLEVRTQLPPKPSLIINIPIIPTLVVSQPLHTYVYNNTTPAVGVVKPHFNVMPRALSTTRRSVQLGSSAHLVSSMSMDNTFTVRALKPSLGSKLALITKVDAVATNSRLKLTQHLLKLTTNFVPAPQSSSITYIVGFGRTHLPYCPNANSNFQWSQQ